MFWTPVGMDVLLSVVSCVHQANVDRTADPSEWRLDALAAKMVQYCPLLEGLTGGGQTHSLLGGSPQPPTQLSGGGKCFSAVARQNSDSIRAVVNGLVMLSCGCKAVSGRRRSKQVYVKQHVQHKALQLLDMCSV